MSQVMYLSAPGIFQAALGLIQNAASDQSPAPTIFPFELGQFEPGQYICLHEITPISLIPEDTSYGFQEHYDLEGSVVVFDGDGVADNLTVTTDVMTTCWSLYYTCVNTPFVSNRTMPILGTTGQSPYQMLLKSATYTAGVGTTADGQDWGWQGVIEFGFHFDSLNHPQDV
jgi:hypothetical protein